MTYPIIQPSGQGKAIYEKHFHNQNQCYGDDGANNLERGSLTPFRITSGVPDVMGTELQIHDGTVIEGGSPLKSFDIGRFFVTASEATDATYFVEIWYGTTTFGAASLLSEFYYRTGSNNAEVVPNVFPCDHIPCNQKLWVRCKCQTTTSWLDFLVEIHSYPWP